MEFNYVNYNFGFSKVVVDNKAIRYYEDDALLLESNLIKVKNIDLPISPIYINDTLILFDYEKGVEIINRNIHKVLKITSAYCKYITNKFIIVITQKKYIRLD